VGSGLGCLKPALTKILSVTASRTKHYSGVSEQTTNSLSIPLEKVLGGFLMRCRENRDRKKNVISVNQCYFLSNILYPFPRLRFRLLLWLLGDFLCFPFCVVRFPDPLKIPLYPHSSHLLDRIYIPISFRVSRRILMVESGYLHLFSFFTRIATTSITHS
jgi:hypothetical protein